MVLASTIINITEAALATDISLSSLAFLAMYSPTENWLIKRGLLALISVQAISNAVIALLHPGLQALFNVFMFIEIGATGGLTIFHI